LPAKSDTTRASQPRLLERERELRLLRGVLEAAAGGDGALAYVEAGPGLGKTRLLAEAAGLAAPGTRVLRARGAELERAFPFGGALQLFEPVVAGPDGTRALRGAARLAGELFDSAGPVTAQAPGAGDYPLLHGLYWIVANLAETGPVVLEIDDAHWIDTSTLCCWHSCKAIRPPGSCALER
jgi:predicted ATPase